LNIGNSLKKHENDTNFFKNAEKVGIMKIRTENTAEDFIKFGTIKLIFKKITVQSPVFVFFEFDNYQPWLIEPNQDGSFLTKFMIPPGRWKLFFTTQLA